MNPLEEESTLDRRKIRLTIGGRSSRGEVGSGYYRNGSSSSEGGSRRRGRHELEARVGASPALKRAPSDWEREGSGEASDVRSPERGWRGSFAGPNTGCLLEEPLLLSPQRGSWDAESLSSQQLLSATKSNSGSRWVGSGSYSPNNASLGSPPSSTCASPKSPCFDEPADGQGAGNPQSIDLLLTYMTADDDLRRQIVDFVASAEVEHRRAVMQVEHYKREKVLLAFHQTHPLNALNVMQENTHSSPAGPVSTSYSVPVRNEPSVAVSVSRSEGEGGRGQAVGKKTMPAGLLWSARLLSAVLCILSLTSMLLPFRTAHFPKAPYKDSPVVLYLYKLEVPYAEARNYSYPEDIPLFDFPSEFRSWRPLLPSRSKAPSIGISYELDEMLKLSTISGLCISTIALACSIQFFFTVGYIFHRSPVFVWAHLTAGLTNFLGLVAYYLTVIRTDSLLTNADSSEWSTGLYVAVTGCLMSVLVPTFGFLCCGLHFDPRWIVRPQQAFRDECPQFPWPWEKVNK